jgi:hypothetical protein
MRTTEKTKAVNDSALSVYSSVHPMEAAGIEPHASGSPLDASGTHTHARMRHIHALRPSCEFHDPSPNAQSIHEQHTAVRGERAHSVHADLEAVITAWPTLSAALRKTILRLIEEEGASR